MVATVFTHKDGNRRRRHVLGATNSEKLPEEQDACMRFVKICSFKTEERASLDPLVGQMLVSRLNKSEENHLLSSHVMVPLPGLAIASLYANPPHQVEAITNDNLMGNPS